LLLVHALNCAGLYDTFCDGTKVLVESLPLFREAIPDWKSYKQEDLVYAILKTSYGVHDTAEDVRALANLLSHLNNKTVLTHSFTVRAIDKNMLFNKKRPKTYHRCQCLYSIQYAKHILSWWKLWGPATCYSSKTDFRVCDP